MHDATGDIEPPAHATGELLHGLVRAIGKAGALECPVHVLRELLAREPVERTERPQILARRQERVERNLLRHDAEIGWRLPAVEHTIEQLNLAAIEPHAPGDRTNQGRLAGAVRAEQREQLPLT